MSAQRDATTNPRKLAQLCAANHAYHSVDPPSNSIAQFMVQCARGRKRPRLIGIHSRLMRARDPNVIEEKQMSNRSRPLRFGIIALQQVFDSVAEIVTLAHRCEALGF